MKKIYALLFMLISSIGMTHAQKEWRSMNSEISVYAFRPGSDEIFCGDVSGNIRQTSDMGKTWKLIAMKSDQIINDLVFINNMDGIATTKETGIVLLTHDGGVSWTRKRFADARAPLSNYPFNTDVRIVKVDEQTAYIDFFSHSISTTYIKEAFVTRDGGNTFKIEYVPGDVYHVNGDTLIAFGREFDMFGLSSFTTYISSDKGTNWNIVKTAPSGLNNGFNFHGVQTAHIFDSKTFLINSNNNLTSDKGIYKTTDGGLTFTLHGTPADKAKHLYFKNKLEGIAATGSALYYTSNGGTSWTKSEGSVQYKPLHIDDSNILASRAGGITSLSNNFGQTWVTQSELIYAGDGSPTSTIVQSMGDDTIYVSSSRINSSKGGELAMTTDGGHTWNYVKDQSENIYKNNVFYFKDKNKMFYSKSGSDLWYSEDAGKTSVSVFPTFWSVIPYNEITFIDDMHGVAYKEGAIVITKNGGTNWVRKTTLPPGELRNMMFPSIATWYALSGTQVYKSVDTGNTWTLSSTGMTSCANKIYFVNASVGYAYGCASNKLYKTTDAAATWVDVTNGLNTSLQNDNFNIMVFRDSENGYLADQTKGYQAKTSNGGTDWQMQIGGSGINAIHFADANTGAMTSVFNSFYKYMGPYEILTDTIEIQTVITGIFNTKKQNSFSIYPNPSSDYIKIKTGSDKEYLLSVYDINGKLQLSKLVKDQENIAVQKLPNGIYSVSIINEDDVRVQKLLIQK